jgi:hypothetical protein
MLTALGQASEIGTTMLGAAHAFLAALAPDQRERAVLPFDGMRERLTWNYTPVPRRGLPFGDMTAAQRHLAHALLSTGVSGLGYRKATTVMSLEQVLHEYEVVHRFERDADRYFISIFDEPSADRTWGWRVEGHHISLHYVLVDGRLGASTPTFFGANPAEVRQGPHSGLRALAEEEDLARELLASLDTGQRSAAVVNPIAPADLLTTNRPLIDPERPTGLPAESLREQQFAALSALIEAYARLMPDEVAGQRLDAYRRTDPRQLWFAWAGGVDRGQKHYYRVQAPSFLIEYDNTQDDANHIHSVWRDYSGDFGRDLLSLHYEAEHSA